MLVQTIGFAAVADATVFAASVAIEKSPIGVTCVHPGGIRTAIARNARIGSAETLDMSRDEIDEQFRKATWTSPERAAQVIVSGVRRGKRRVLIGPDARVLSLMQRLLPVRYQHIVAFGAARRRSPI